MKKPAVIAAFAACIALAGAIVISHRTPVEPVTPKAVPFRMDASKKKCLFLRPGGPLESKPQGPDYRGGCLEYLPHLELEGGEDLPLSLFTGATGDGGPPPIRNARAHFDGRPVNLQFAPVNVGAHPFGPVQFYKVSLQGRDLCADEGYDWVPESSEKLSASLLTNLRGTAVAIPGYWEKGAWHASAVNAPGTTSFSLSCVSGAMAKCALWGYAPWARRDGVSLADYHAACVYGTRADYLDKSDTSYTCRGTVIDMYDRLGILKKDPKNPSFRFESRWKKDGLDCLAESRFPVCTTELSVAGLQSARGACTDPSVSGWPDGVLIAIGSSSSNSVTDPFQPEAGPVCPSQLEDGCVQP